MKAVVGFFFVLLAAFVPERPAHATAILFPSLSISEEYTDNFFFTEHDLKSDFTTILSPVLLVKQETRDMILSGSYFGGITLQLKNNERNRYRQGMTFDMGLPMLSRQFRGLEVRITDVAEYSPELHAAPLTDVDTNFFETAIGRVETFRNRAAMKASRLWSPQWNTAFVYTHTMTHYNRSDFDNMMAHDTDLSGTYNIRSGIQTVSAAYGILKTRFERAENIMAHRILVSGKQAFDPTSFMYGGIGENWVEGGNRNLIAQIGYSKKVHLTLFKMGYSRTTELGEGGIAAITLRQGGAAEFAHPISAKSIFALKLEHKKHHTLSGPTVDTSSSGATTSLATMFLPWLTCTIRYTYLDYSEPCDLCEGQGAGTRSVKNNRVMVMFSATPLGWKYNP
jgi:hypothetical protein